MTDSNRPNVLAHSLFSDEDIALFRTGKHYDLHLKLGSHLIEVDGQKGVQFAVWAPNAERVTVIGNFNFWLAHEHPLYPRWDGSGIWEGFIPGIGNGEAYKYHILSKVDGQQHEKADPFAYYWEIPPRTASVVWDIQHEWNDQHWMQTRSQANALNRPFSVYEVHLASWKRKVEEGMRSLTYAELAAELVPYVKEMGFTHVEFMPVMEHPFGGSWGYQGLGYFAPTSRFGTPQDYMHLVEAFHNEGIGVILDWVPSHFPGDAHGLYRFDGTALYEHEDPRKGFHPDWKSYIFNYGRNEVRSFLISSAIFWLGNYHADGIRVDAVASMLYLDYSRNAGEWIPNQYGGRENLEAVSLLRELNEAVYARFPDIQMIAEESTSWPLVSRPTFLGGLGFGMKWMMGWMNDTLEYFKHDPIYRKYHQNELTQSLTYAFTENFMLPLSHDEVVHGKGPLIGRMPGDEWQRFANLRLLYGWMYTHPGTKLLFMGSEIGQTSEWVADDSLHWDLLQHAPHQGVSRWVKALNTLYSSAPAMYERGFESEGMLWIDHADHENSVLAFIRRGLNEKDDLLVVINLTPRPHDKYRIGIHAAGEWNLALNSDDSKFFGSNYSILVSAKSKPIPSHGHPQSLELNLPPLGIIIYRRNA
ncbi:MAG: 1,4-alpha-glucan branching protein GlgB [Bacteroidetes bacterium]|nr:1,4-alpha-glucan branching protein GlgB [Bacteroidota bacterium]